MYNRNCFYILYIFNEFLNEQYFTFTHNFHKICNAKVQFHWKTYDGSEGGLLNMQKVKCLTVAFANHPGRDCKPLSKLQHLKLFRSLSQSKQNWDISSQTISFRAPIESNQAGSGNFESLGILQESRTHERRGLERESGGGIAPAFHPGYRSSLAKQQERVGNSVRWKLPPAGTGRPSCHR